MQLKSTFKRIDNISTQNLHKIYPRKPSLREKNPTSKSIHLHVLFNKNIIAIQPWKPSKP